MDEDEEIDSIVWYAHEPGMPNALSFHYDYPVPPSVAREDLRVWLGKHHVLKEGTAVWVPAKYRASL